MLTQFPAINVSPYLSAYHERQRLFFTVIRLDRSPTAPIYGPQPKINHQPQSRSNRRKKGDL
jgi:hypothetical protein